MSFQKCAVDGCQYVANGGYSSGHCYCDFHGELFERGPQFRCCSSKVTEYAAWWAVRELKVLLSRIDRCVFESEACKLIDEASCSAIRDWLPHPDVLDRKTFVNGIGQRVPEPARVYAQRVSAALINFVVDKAVSGSGLAPAGRVQQPPLPFTGSLELRGD